MDHRQKYCGVDRQEAAELLQQTKPIFQANLSSTETANGENVLK